MITSKELSIKISTFALYFLLILSGCSSSNNNSNSETSLYGDIAHIHEASGISYCIKNDTLYVAGDNGFLYQISNNGEILKQKNFSYLKNHDFEGISYDIKNDEILVAVEGSDNVLALNTNLIIKRTINIDRKDDQGRLILAKDKENGLEGIAVQDGIIYLSNQSFQRLPNDDPSVLIKIIPVTNSLYKIDKVIDHGFLNISGLAFLKNKLYMITDTGNILIQYDLKTKQVIKTIKIKSFDDILKGKSIEGITFDNKGNIYFADDTDGTIYKYKFN